MSISLGGSLHHILHWDVRQAIGDVLLDCPSKQHRLLAHQRNLQKRNRKWMKPHRDTWRQHPSWEIRRERRCEQRHNAPWHILRSDHSDHFQRRPHPFSSVFAHVTWTTMKDRLRNWHPLQNKKEEPHQQAQRLWYHVCISTDFTTELETSISADSPKSCPVRC